MLLRESSRSSDPIHHRDPLITCFINSAEEPYEGHYRISLNYLKAIRSVGAKAYMRTLCKHDICAPIFTSMKFKEKTIWHVLNVDEFRFLPIKFLRNVRNRYVKLIKHVFYPYLYVRTSPHVVAQIRNVILQTNFIDAITISSKLVHRYVKMIDIDEERIHFINIPVDQRIFLPSDIAGTKIRLRYGLSLEDRILLYIGQIEHLRGAFELLKAFKVVTQQLPSLKLVFASPGTTFERRFWPDHVKLIRQLGLSNKVLNIGFVKQVSDVYNAADLVVLPFQAPYKITDPPLTILEALSCGKPLITTPYGSAKCIIKDGINGFITGPAYDHIASTITNVLSMSEERLTLIKRCARETILRDFSLEVVGCQLLKVYRSLFR